MADPLSTPQASASSPSLPTTPATAAASGSRKTRSKDGCLVCRARRIKCDNERPECARCVKYGSECVWPVKKPFDPVATEAALAKRHRKKSTTTTNHELGLGLDPSISNADIGAGAGGGGSIPYDIGAASISAALAHVTPYDPSSMYDDVIGTGTGTVTGTGNGMGSGHVTPVYDSSFHSSGRYHLEQPLLSYGHGTEHDNRGDQQHLQQQHQHQGPLGTFNVDELMAFARQTQMGAFFRKRIDPPDFLRPAFPDPDELACFHHCVTYSFSICVTREDFNPWVQHIAPLFLFPDGKAPLAAEAVRWTMLRIGAIHLCYLDARDPSTPTNGAHARRLAEIYRGNAVRLLRQARQVEMEAGSDTYLAALIMFLLAEFLGSSTQWREIHRMLRAAVLGRGGCEQLLFGTEMKPETPSSLRKYLIEQVVKMEMMASDVQTQVPTLLLGDLGWFDRLGHLVSEDNEAESIEATYGIHRSIFKLGITQATLVGQTEHASLRLSATSTYQLGQAQHSAATGTGTGTANSLSLLPDPTITQQWLSDMRSWRSNKPLLDSMDHRTRLGSLACWHACMMGFHRVIESKERTDADVQVSAVAVLDAVVEAGDKVEYLLWPLFVACINIQSPVLRTRAREILKSFQYQCCFEVDAAARVVEETWRRVDEGRDEEACDYREIMMELGLAVLLD